MENHKDLSEFRKGCVVPPNRGDAVAKNVILVLTEMCQNTQ